MTNEYTPALEEQFNKDCTVINLKYEYPGFTGTEQYAIMTDLSPKELEDYGELLAQYEPYLILGKSNYRCVHDLSSISFFRYDYN